MRYWVYAAMAVAGLGTTGCDDPPPTYSGTVCLSLEHHGVPHFGATVYRNFGEGFPGYHADMALHFDTVAETGLRNTVCFERLGVGPHWFAAEGWDDFIRDSVRGSLFLRLDVRQSRIDTILQVTEQH